MVTTNTTTGKETTALFDYVICCTGHFSSPNVPQFPGMATFPGRIMHAHDFRSAEEFTDKRILVIGTSYSAEDIASQCYKYGVKSVHCSWRTAPMGFHWPENFTTVPLLTSIAPGTKTCTFKDGSTAEIDAIILCTGYQHSFPFVEPALRLKTTNRLWCDELHEGVVMPNNHRMMYIGMQDQWFTFNMFDAQAWYCRDVILGKIALPNAATMKAEWEHWRAAEEAVAATDEANIRYQAAYTQRMQAYTDYPAFDIEGVVQCFMEWEHHKHENIMYVGMCFWWGGAGGCWGVCCWLTFLLFDCLSFFLFLPSFRTFRDHAHTSLMTGNKAPVHHTPWLTAFDDSIESYVEGNKKKVSNL